jgi:hypothetical protein
MYLEGLLKRGSLSIFKSVTQSLLPLAYWISKRVKWSQNFAPLLIHTDQIVENSKKF